MSELLIISKSNDTLVLYKKKNFNIASFIDNLHTQIYVGSKIINSNIDISKLNDGDIIEYDEEKSYYVVFNNASDDNAIVVTNKCNSNCVMCPCSEFWRKKENVFDKNKIIKLISMIDPNTKFLTLTGGEPTLVGNDFFDILDAINSYLQNTKILVLTNGRTLSNTGYFANLIKHLPKDIRFGIPLYSSEKSIHDLMTNSPNSFNETILGLKNLIANHIETEIRIVPIAINNNSLNSLCSYIAESFHGVDCVNIMAMELTGSAAVNKEKIWIDYKQSFNSIKEGIVRLIKSGIDVRLYNFPLCKIDNGYRYLSHKSISDYKVRYLENCKLCKHKNECGGVFYSTLALTKMKLTAYEN